MVVELGGVLLLIGSSGGKFLVSELDLAIDVSGLVGLAHVGHLRLDERAAVRRHAWLLLLLLKEEDLLLHEEELLMKLLWGQRGRRVVHVHELRLVGIDLAWIRIHEVLAMDVHSPLISSHWLRLAARGLALARRAIGTGASWLRP